MTGVRDVRVGRLADNAIVVSWTDDCAEEGERFCRWFENSDAEQRIRDALGFASDLYAVVGREQRGSGPLGNVGEAAEILGGER